MSTECSLIVAALEDLSCCSRPVYISFNPRIINARFSIEVPKALTDAATIQRALRAHMYTYMALYELALEQFFIEMPHLQEVCLKPTAEIQEACKKSCSRDGERCIKDANTRLFQALTEEDVIQQLIKWEDQKSSNAMFKSMTYAEWKSSYYLLKHPEMLILLFIWKLEMQCASCFLLLIE